MADRTAKVEAFSDREESARAVRHPGKDASRVAKPNRVSAV
jgi:hypothetical protein